MYIKDITWGDLINYKKISAYIVMPFCDFKCEKELGIKCCQNSSLTKLPTIDISSKTIIDTYLQNDMVEAVVFAGLEPLDSWVNLTHFIEYFRKETNDDIVIFSGYNEDEVKDKIEWLQQFPNIIVKFGRFLPNQESHYDDVLGVYLASSNQYAKKIS